MNNVAVVLFCIQMYI